MSVALVELEQAAQRLQRVEFVPVVAHDTQDRPALHSVCPSGHGGLPGAYAELDLDSLGALALSNQRFKTGQALYRSGAALHAIYMVRAGFVKTVALRGDGREQVTGFFMPGEVFGVDAVAADRYLADAFALEDCEVCVIPYAELESLSSRIQALHRLVYRLLSREIARKQEMMFVLGSMRADERLATFLVNLSNRLDARGLSSSDFVLRMTREEIGSFLGLCVETVSRLFSRMHRDGVLAIDGKHVCITDGDRLKGMVGH